VVSLVVSQSFQLLPELWELVGHMGWKQTYLIQRMVAAIVLQKMAVELMCTADLVAAPRLRKGVTSKQWEALIHGPRSDTAAQMVLVGPALCFQFNLITQMC
jgi:hypothetical protein